MNPLLLFMAMLDFLTVAALILLQYDVLPTRLAIITSGYLLFKGFSFFGDIASMIDLVIGLYVLAVILFGFHTFLTYIFIIYVLQKAILSLF
jgi:hypothetical protein